jgi:hypothetical protein
MISSAKAPAVSSSRFDTDDQTSFDGRASSIVSSTIETW